MKKLYKILKKGHRQSKKHMKFNFWLKLIALLIRILHLIAFVVSHFLRKPHFILTFAARALAHTAATYCFHLLRNAPFFPPARFISRHQQLHQR